MPGFDKSRFVDISVEDLHEFTCPICQDIFIKPIVTECCRQTYCKECIEEWLNENTTCPNDRKLLNKNKLLEPPRLVINLLNKMRVKCEFYSNGCEVIVAIDESLKHSNECLKNPNRVCEVCGFKIEGQNKHECLVILQIRNMSISHEINKLVEENKALKKENQEWKRSNLAHNIENVNQNIIETARNRIDDVVVLENQGFISERYFQQCIDKSKFAIKNYSSFQAMAEYIYNWLNSSLDQGENWNVLVASSDGAWSIVHRQKYLRLQFGSLKIILYSSK